MNINIEVTLEFKCPSKEEGNYDWVATDMSRFNLTRAYHILPRKGDQVKIDSNDKVNFIIANVEEVTLLGVNSPAVAMIDVNCSVNWQHEVFKNFTGRDPRE